MELRRLLLRAALTPLQQLRRLFWWASGRRGRGVLAVPLTPEGRVVLVRLTYAPGWRIPGGGVDAGEGAAEAALRELREEIGMTSHGEISCVDPRGDSPLFLVRDVLYSPRRSFEIAEVGEFDVASLPPGARPLTRRLVAEAIAFLRSA